MQNTVSRENEKGESVEVVIYEEYEDPSGFRIREMLHTKNPNMKFQAGKAVVEPMVIPMFEGRNKTTPSHYEFSPKAKVSKFHLHGFGRSQDDAIKMATDKLLRIELRQMGKS